MTDEFTYKQKTEITQIIPWADKEKFFWGITTCFGDTPCDLIILKEVNRKKKDFFPKADYQNIALDKGLEINVYGEHNFKVGDIVELEVSMKKTRGGKNE
jgi:hypothetical protein